MPDDVALTGFEIHVLTEVACRSGHLGAVRELIDGTTWLGGSPYAGWGLLRFAGLNDTLMRAATG